jgi:N-sulfoglucosamine sulfohydrolase
MDEQANMKSLSRREFIKRSGAAGAGLAAWPILSKAADAPSRSALPNLVVYMSDDHGMLYSKPYGHPDIHTPNFEQLASEGVRFTQAFNASPTCGPSRTAMLTGLWPARNGAEPNHKPPKPGVTGLPGVLKALGYEMACFGKIAHNDYAKFYNFDIVHGPNIGYEKSADVVNYLTTRDKSKPLCLFFGVRFPHVPWAVNAGYDPASLHLPPTLVDTPGMRSEFSRYCTSVSKSDAVLGEVRAAVKEHLPGETLFVYTADHGAQLPFAKWDLYDAGTRVPLLVSWPGHVEAGTTRDATVCLPDLLPTLIEIAGGKVPEGLDGKSFAQVLIGKTNVHRDRTFATHSGDGDFNVYPCRSLRKDGFKYILNLHSEFQHHTHISRSPNPNSGMAYWQTWLEAAKTDPAAAAIVKRYTERPAEELYDLKADPYEMHNLAADLAQAQRLATMRTELKAWMKDQGDTETVFGKPLLIGQPITLIPEGGGQRKKNGA